MKRSGEIEAQSAVDAIKRARASAGDVNLFGEPVAPDADAPSSPRRGRPPGARNKTARGLREMLAAQGYRSPAEVLARVAGLHSREDVMLLAIGRARALLEASRATVSVEDARAALEAAQTDKQRQAATDVLLAALNEGMRIADALPDLAAKIMKEQASAAGQLMPYVEKRLTPEVHDNRTQTVVNIASAPVAADTGRRVAPPPMPELENVEYQRLSDEAPSEPDGGN